MGHEITGVFHWGEGEAPVGDSGFQITPEEAVRDLLSWAIQEWGGASTEFEAGAVVMAYWQDGDDAGDPPAKNFAAFYGFISAFETWRFVHRPDNQISGTVIDRTAFGRMQMFTDFLGSAYPDLSLAYRRDYLQGAYFMAYYFHGIPGRLPDREAVAKLIAPAK